MEDKIQNMSKIGCFLFLVIFLACGIGDEDKTEDASQNTDTTSINDEKLRLEENEDSSLKTSEDGGKKRDSLLKEVVKEKSKHRNKSCEEILEDYRKLVDQVYQNPSDANIYRKVLSFSNDPFFAKCKRENESFKKKVHDLEKIID